MQHRVLRRREIGAQILPALLADIAGVDMGEEQIDILENVPEDAVFRQELRQLFAQHEEGGVIVRHVDHDVVDIVAPPDLAQHAGIGFRVPDPALHRRIALPIEVAQQFRRQVAHPAMVPVARKRILEGGEPGVGRRGVGHAVEQRPDRCADGRKALPVEIGPDPAAHGWHEGAQFGEHRRLQAGRAARKRIPERNRFQLQGVDVALDAALLLAAGDQAFQRLAQARSGQMQLRPLGDRPVPSRRPAQDLRHHRLRPLRPPPPGRRRAPR